MKSPDHIPTANSIYIDIVRARWPGHTVAGTGHIAVLFRCCHHVELCGHLLEARQRIAERCGAVCRAAAGERVHAAYDLNTPPLVKPRASMKKLPGWKED